MKPSEQAQQLFTLAELPAHLPEVNGRPISAKVLWRWIRIGVTRRCDGTVVRLWAENHGGRWVTSVKAVENFKAELARRPAFNLDTIGTAAQQALIDEQTARVKDQLTPRPGGKRR